METVTANDVAVVDVVKTPKRKGPPKGFKMPENIAPVNEFVKIWLELFKDGSLTSGNMVNALHEAGYHATIGTVISRERNLREKGVKLPEKTSSRGKGGGRATNVASLNDMIAAMSGDDMSDESEVDESVE